MPSIDAGLFRAQLSQRLVALGSGVATPDLSAVLQSKLEKKIGDLLNAGTKPSDVVAQLAASLASSVATMLGTTSANAREQLKSAFASALAPPGQTGPPQRAAEQARTLAQRFRSLAETATRVSSGESGQLNRFVGNVLDAKSARETPAPAPQQATPNAGTDLVVRDVLEALAPNSFASPQAGLTALPQTPQLSSVANAVVSDGRFVALGSRVQAIATGGDTPLGRILARAALAADQRQAPVVVETDGTLAPASLGSRTPADPAVSAFLRAFESAIATHADKNDVKGAPLDDGSFASLPSSATPSSPTANAPAFMPVAAPLMLDSSTLAAPQTPFAPPAHPVPADTNAIVDQVLRGAFMRNLGTSSEMHLKLVPEHLGDVSVKLIVNGGSVTAQVVAQTADVRDALVAGQSQLSRSLADAGLKLTSFTVDVANGGFAGFAQQQSQSQQRPSFGRRTLIAGIDADESGEDDGLLATPSFGPPLLANRHFSHLNYLV